MRPALRAWLNSPFASLWRRSDLLSGGLDTMSAFVVARHRAMDDILEAALRRDLSQAVVLGAGYDTRAWRFREALAGRPLFEVDFPATQARKREIVASGGLGEVPGHRFVGVDFERQRFDAALGEHDFRAQEPALFVWEGVTMYLQRATVMDTLRRIRALGGPGTEVVADFFFEPGRSLWRRTVRLGGGFFAAIGEPLEFSLDPQAAPAFFEELGYEIVLLSDQTEMLKRYGRKAPTWQPPLFVVHARAR